MVNTNILIVDDDQEHTSLLTEFLAQSGFVAHTALTGRAGLQACTPGAYDLVLLDVMLPDASGIEILHQLRRNCAVPVVMLTARGNECDRLAGLDQGADDYIAKPFSARELVARIRAILRRTRESATQAGAAELLELGIDDTTKQLNWRGCTVDLTPSEVSLLRELLAASPRTVSKQDLSLRIFGRQWKSYDRSIDVHVSHIRRKLQHITEGALDISAVRGLGYRLETDKA